MAKGKGKKKRNLYKTRELHIMLLPAVILTAVFAYLPMFGLVMAFQEFKPLMGFLKSPFVGLEQFKYIFTMPSFRTEVVQKSGSDDRIYSIFLFMGDSGGNASGDFCI